MSSESFSTYELFAGNISYFYVSSKMIDYCDIKRRCRRNVDISTENVQERDRTNEQQVTEMIFIMSHQKVYVNN